jgi:hypothetical protein
MKEVGSCWQSTGRSQVPGAYPGAGIWGGVGHFLKFLGKVTLLCAPLLPARRRDLESRPDASGFRFILGLAVILNYSGFEIVYATVSPY